MRFLAALCTLILATTSASAAVVYSFTGADYTLTRDAGLDVDLGSNLTGEVRLDAPLPEGPTSFISEFPDFTGELPIFSFTSGDLTITDESPDLHLAVLRFTADTQGSIINWDIELERRSIMDDKVFGITFETEDSSGFLPSRVTSAEEFSCTGVQTETVITCSTFDDYLGVSKESVGVGTWTARTVPDNSAVIPLPAGGVLLVTALAGLAVSRRLRMGGS